MKLYATGKVVALTGLPSTTFDAWCKAGYVPSVNSVAGQGNHRIFDLTTVLGVAVAAELRRQPRGCAAEYVGKVVAAFRSLGEERLRKQLEGGATHFMTIVTTTAGETVVLDDPKYDDMIDVAELYQRILQN